EQFQVCFQVATLHQRRQHLTARSVAMQDVIVDHHLVEPEWHLRFELEGYRLIEPFAVAERQEECPQGDQLSRERRQHRGRIEPVGLQEAPYFVRQALFISANRLTIKAGDSIVAERGLEDRGLQFVRVELERQNALRHAAPTPYWTVLAVEEVSSVSEPWSTLSNNAAPPSFCQSRRVKIQRGLPAGGGRAHPAP